MIKTNLFRFSALVLAILLSTGANAQTKIWGAGAAVGSAEGEFQNAFSTTASTTAWEARSINHGGGAVTPGNALWTRTTTGGSQGAYGSLDITGLPNCTFANGAALFDSDWYDNGGTQGAFGTGTAPTSHQGQLISPRIDLTGYTNQQLVVKFNCFWRNFQATFTVSMSTDDGLTWTDVDMQNVLPSPTNSANSGYATAPFYTVTAGVNNLTQCRLKFTYDGDYYGAHVDDVVIELASAYDIALRTANPSGNTLGDAFTDVKIGNNRFIPCGNVDITDLREWFWGLSAVNNGANDILPPANPRAYLSIDFINSSGATTNNVYLDTLDFDTLVAGAADNVTLSEELRDLAFTQTYGAGDYVFTYWVAHDSTDATSDNDTVQYAFTLTDVTGPFANYMSKARLSANDGRVLATRPIFPGGTTFSDFEYGSMFYFPKGATDSIGIDSVVFRFYVPNGYTGAATQTALVNIYEFDETLTGATADGAVDASAADLAYIGAQIVPLTGLGTTVANGSYGLATAAGFVNPANGLAMDALKDGGYYVISLQNTINLPTGVLPPYDSDGSFWFGADEYNYAINAASTSAATIIPNPSPVKVIDGAGTGDWNWVGFGADILPSIGAYLSISSLHTSTGVVAEAEGVEFSVYPNPATDIINVNLELDEAQDVTYILTDAAGRILTRSIERNIEKANYSMDVTSFPAGVYFLTAETANGKASTYSFVKK